MRLLILGASGRTGRLATAEALKRGHEVLALVRRASSLSHQTGLTVMEGTPLNRVDIDAVFTSAAGTPDAVLVTLASLRASDSPFAKPIGPAMFIRDSVRNTIAAMQKHAVKRLVVMSAFGTGGSFAQVAWPLRLLFRHSNMRLQYEDHDAVDAEVQGSDGIEWMLVRPPMLKEGEAKGVREFGEVGLGVGMFDSVTRADVAEFMIGAVEEDTWVKKVVVIAN